jgi:hypothetical protein
VAFYAFYAFLATLLCTTGFIVAIFNKNMEANKKQMLVKLIAWLLWIFTFACLLKIMAPVKAVFTAIALFGLCGMVVVLCWGSLAGKV